MESISASEDVDDAISESDVVGVDGEIVMLSTAGAVLDDWPLIETTLERAQEE